jgi:outer membrane putative beta-barrel porin/alpha-amylase
MDIQTHSRPDGASDSANEGLVVRFLHAITNGSTVTTIARHLVFASMALCSGHVAMAQTLAPRAYVITPVHGNAVTLSWSYYDGGLDFNGAIPVTGATGTYHIPVLSYYHSFSLFGRSANLTGFLPYGVGTFGGSVFGSQRQVYRSGLLDVGVRFSVNLKGGPAMAAPQFVKWKQKGLLGASLAVVAPTGQYDPKHLVNWGINRWAFKPELGYSQRWGNWLLDGYGGVWFYTTNNAFYSVPNPQPQTEKPIGSLEGHLSHDFARQRYWASLDGNFWFGGTTGLNGVLNPATRQTSSRIGATFAFPLSRHQSIKVSYSDGTYVRFGGNYQSVSVAWQYSWLGWPKFHEQ